MFAPTQIFQRPLAYPHRYKPPSTREAGFRSGLKQKVALKLF